MKNEYDAAELDRLYENSVACDSDIYSEMRSNILLVSGDHYNKMKSKFWSRIRDTKSLDESQKLRLVKNHIRTVCNRITAHVLSGSADTMIVPTCEKELRDQKSAELRNSVWKHYKKKLGFTQQVIDLCESYVQLGEVFVKQSWDMNKGRFLGYNQKVDENGIPEIDEMGQMVPDEESPVMGGELSVEEILGFDVFRDPEAKTFEDSPYLGIRKMVGKDSIKKLITDPELDADKILNDASEETYKVFDATTGKYAEDKKSIMLREWYFRKSPTFPNGYYYITVKGNILSEGELPAGVFPIRYAGYDRIKTSCRFRSPIKQMRPFQIEINRSASAIATAQVTLGDPKLLLPNGAKLTNGASQPGVRVLSVNGAMGDPKIIQGASGENYLPYMQSQITELYEAMEVEENEPMKNGGLDPYALLFFSVKNREKFSKYAQSFETFICGITEDAIKLIQYYIPDDELVPIIGRSEAVNIPEFKTTDEARSYVKVEAISGNTNTMLGKQLALTHVLQYVGGSLDKTSIGKIIRVMPYLNEEEAFSDLTMPYDNATNDILALERGEQPVINKYEDLEYLVNRLANRMRKSDFRFLTPEVQQNFENYKMQIEQAQTEKLTAIQRAQDGFIPVDGPMVGVDLYVDNKDGQPRRAKVPGRAVEWLLKQLESQGVAMDKLEAMNQQVQAELAQNVAPQQQAMPMQQSMPLSQQMQQPM